MKLELRPRMTWRCFHRVPARRFFAWGLIGFLVLAWAGGIAAAQISREVEEPGKLASDAEPGLDIHPDAVSRFVTRTYKIGSKELWKGLLKLLEESGYPPEEVDEKEKVVAFAFIRFYRNCDLTGPSFVWRRIATNYRNRISNPRRSRR